MEAQRYSSLGVDGKMQFTMLATSRGRSWNGVDAMLYHTSGGFAEQRGLDHHSVCMYVGFPITAACRCDGVMRRGLQRPGSIDVIPPGVASAWEEDGPTTTLSVDLSRSLLESTADAIGIRPVPALAPRIQISDSKLEHMCWGLKAELEHGDREGRLFAESIGVAMAAHLLRPNVAVEIAVAKRGLTRRQLNATMDFIDAHLAGDISLSAIARAAGLSPSHFNTLFKRSVGQPVHRYVVQRRVERAVDLICRRGMRLSSAALEAGFADQSHMARCMRRVLGVTPTEVVRSI